VYGREQYEDGGEQYEERQESAWGSKEAELASRAFSRAWVHPCLSSASCMSFLSCLSCARLSHAHNTMQFSFRYAYECHHYNRI
jgi:hypothetical protein